MALSILTGSIRVVIRVEAAAFSKKGLILGAEGGEIKEDFLPLFMFRVP